MPKVGPVATMEMLKALFEAVESSATSTKKSWMTPVVMAER